MKKERKDKSPYRNPIVVAMNERYGRQKTSHKLIWDDKGGDRNEQYEFLEELEDEQEDGYEP